MNDLKKIADDIRHRAEWHDPVKIEWADTLDALAAQSGPRLVPDCSKCEGRGYIDEGHLRDDGRMDRTPESCPNCYGTGKSHTCGERASCIPCEREDADKELEAKLRVRLLGAAARLRMRAACELNQPRGHTMDAREWASTCLECAAEDIEAEAGGRAPQPAPPQPAAPEEFQDALSAYGAERYADGQHYCDYNEGTEKARAEVLRLYALASAAPQPTAPQSEPATMIETIPVDETHELRKIDGFWQLFAVREGTWVRSLNGYECEFVDCAIRSAALQTAARLAAPQRMTVSREAADASIFAFKVALMQSECALVDRVNHSETSNDDAELARLDEAYAQRNAEVICLYARALGIELRDEG